MLATHRGFVVILFFYFRKQVANVALRVTDILRDRQGTTDKVLCTHCEHVMENMQLQRLEISGLRDTIERFEELCQCPICYNNYIDSLPVILKCGHVVCKVCSNVLRECHACRAPVVKSDIKNIYFVWEKTVIQNTFLFQKRMNKRINASKMTHENIFWLAQQFITNKNCILAVVKWSVSCRSQ